jgi:hypothetical protein
MIWLSWRLFRMQAAITAVALALVAVAAAAAGTHIAALYQGSGIRACNSLGDCGARASSFLTQVNANVLNHLPLLLGTVLVAVPAILGMFWGAPLVASELEAGTHRLAWNQSVSRSRWLAIKLALSGLATVTAAGVFSLIVTWSAGPIDQVNMDRLLPATFGERGVAPAAYAGLALALGLAAGILIRRTVPAMALTLAGYTAVQAAMRWIRPHLISPVHAITAVTASDIGGIGIHVLPDGSGTMTLTGATSLPGRWVLADQTINAAGQPVTDIPLTATGPLSVQSCTGAQARSCLAHITGHGYRQLLTYQPASRFWAFQWHETAIFAVLTAAIIAFSFWWLLHRIS